MANTQFLRSYRQLFSLPRFGSSLLAAVAGKLQPGVSSVAVLLEVAHYRGFEQAAVVVTAFALAGITVPVRGRLMDRHGHALVMCPALVVDLLALAVLVLNDRADGPFAVTVAAAFVASASAPPIQIATRLMWRELAPDELRPAILSLDAVLADVGFIVGPTVGAFLVVVVAPWAAVAASALLSAIAVLVLVTRGLPRQREQPQSAVRQRLGPLRIAALRRAMAAAVLFAMAVRAIELAFPAWAQQHDAPLMSGVLLSCMSVGSMAGGLVLGALPPQRSIKATLSATLGVLCLGTLLAAAASLTSTAILVVAAALMGIALGPSFVALYATAGDLSPANMAAETQSWVSSFMSFGGAAGAAISGLIIQDLGAAAVLVLATVALAVGAGLGRLTVHAKPVAPQRVPAGREREAE